MCKPLSKKARLQPEGESNPAVVTGVPIQQTASSPQSQCVPSISFKASFDTTTTTATTATNTYVDKNESAHEEKAGKLYDKLYAAIQGKVLGKRVGGKLNTSENANILMLNFVPDISLIIGTTESFSDIKDSAKDILAYRVFASKDDSILKRYDDYCSNVQKRLIKGAMELEGDIKYWGNQIFNNQSDFSAITGTSEQVHLTKLGISAVKLARSDLHGRGLGVAFVTFTGTGKRTSPKKIINFTVVLKPDQRVIEESLLADTPTSLASKFNRYTWWIREDPAQKFEDKSGAQRIMTIPMKTSSMHSGCDHGTIVKKIIDDNLNQAAQLDFIATMKTIVFAYFAGISDLHEHNVLYAQEKGICVPFLIDADVAFNQPELMSLTRTRQQSGFLRKDSLSELRIVEYSKSIVDDIKAAFRGKFGRWVPFATETFQSDRAAFVFELKFCDGSREINTIPYRVEELGKIPNFELIKKEIEENQLKHDFLHGQIPFYTHSYDSGCIAHNGIIIGRIQSLDDILKQVLEAFKCKKS